MILGIDTGGTFTDVVSIDATGKINVLKVPSTPKDPGIAVRNSVDAILVLINQDPHSIDSIAHGTTVSTNVRFSVE